MRSDLVLIQKAVTLEKKRYEDYKKLSGKVRNAEAKEVLIKLANIEKRHYLLLKTQIKSIKKFSEINLDVLIKNELKLLKKDTNFDRVVLFISQDIDVVKKAERSEREDPPFYEALLKHTTNKQLKKVFQFLKKEEIQHLNTLKLKLKDLQILSSKLSVSKDPRALFYYMVRK